MIHNRCWVFYSTNLSTLIIYLKMQCKSMANGRFSCDSLAQLLFSHSNDIRCTRDVKWVQRPYVLNRAQLNRTLWIQFTRSQKTAVVIINNKCLILHISVCAGGLLNKQVHRVTCTKESVKNATLLWIYWIGNKIKCKTRWRMANWGIISAGV